MKLSENKKGLDGFSLVLTILAIVALTIILIGTVLKHSQIREELGAAGDDALFLLEVYDEADDALLYVDSAAKFALQSATYDLGQHCFGTSCPWTSAKKSEDDSCVITGLQKEDRIHRENLERYLVRRMDSTKYMDDDMRHYGMRYYIDNLNELPEEKTLHEKTYEIHKDGYTYQFRSVPESGNPTGTEVIATAENPYVIKRGFEASSDPVVEYKVMPSFREKIDIPVFGHFKEIKAKVFDEEDSLAAHIETKLNGKKSDETARNAFEDEVEDKGKDSRLEWRVVEFEEEPCQQVCQTEERCTMDEEICQPLPHFYAGSQYECKTEEVSGFEDREYCSVTAEIIVRIADERFKDGFRQFYSVSEGILKDYEYKFKLQWDELETECVCPRRTEYMGVVICRR